MTIARGMMEEDPILLGIGRVIGRIRVMMGDAYD
jgi:hypothetical protein